MVIVVVAATMAALIVIVAIVVDLGGARSARSNDQNTVDAMALAGAAKINPNGGSNQAACQAAWNYLVTNTSVIATPAPGCSAFAGTCDATHTRQLTEVRDDYKITLVNPVPDSHDFFDEQPATSTDSTPCQRFGVRIEHTWNHVLQPGDTTLVTTAVSRFTHAPGTVDAPLIILDPHGCEVLSVTGNSHVTSSTSTGQPGYVAIDSDGADCDAGKKVVVDTTGNAQITAGAIAMWALTQGNTASAYDPSDVGEGRGFNPAPIASSAPVGRSAIDWRYNCSSANGCPTAGTASIDQLVAAYGTGTPSGFTRWTSAYSCSATGNIIVPRGDWYIDCPSGLTSSDIITFRGGNIVADGPFNMGGNGALRINCDVVAATTACPSDPADPAIVFLRNGALSKSGNVNLTMHETFVYVASGEITMTGTGTLTWTAPDDSTFAFDDLLVWNEGTGTMTMTGNTDTVMEGIFFAPNGALDLVGNSGVNSIGSQLFVRTAALTGDTDLTLAPRSDRVMQLGGAGSALIR